MSSGHTVTLTRGTDRTAADFYAFAWVETVDGVEVKRGRIERFGPDYYAHAVDVARSIAGTYGAVYAEDTYATRHAMFSS